MFPQPIIFLKKILLNSIAINSETMKYFYIESHVYSNLYVIKKKMKRITLIKYIIIS